MSKQQIRHIIEQHSQRDGLTETGIKGVQLFQATSAIPCVPAVYEPCAIAIVSGAKEAVLDGKRYVYDDSRYMCCPMSMPVKAGTPSASPQTPLYGVLIALDARLMAELSLEMESAGNLIPLPPATCGRRASSLPHGMMPSLTRCCVCCNWVRARPTAPCSPMRACVSFTMLFSKGGRGLCAARLWGGQCRCTGDFACRCPFGRAHLYRRYGPTRRDEPRGISPQVQKVTTMSPIQFVKSMRLNNAAMKIAGGSTVSEAAMGVGYVSASQFSREFKRMYGQSPANGATRSRWPPGWRRENRPPPLGP